MSGHERFNILKNYIAISIAFSCLFAAINSVATIQPILNQDQNLGSTGQIITFSVQIIASLILPQILIQFLGFKWALIFAELLQASYVAIQIHVRIYTLVPSSILAGIGNSALWTTIGIFVKICSKNYSQLMNIDFTKTVTLFFGICSSIFLMSNVLGYGLIAFILDTGSQGPSNSSAPFDYAKSCGLRNCPSTPLPSSQSNPTRQSFYIYYVCLLCLCGASVLITFFFIDNIKENSDYEEIDKPTVCKKLRTEVSSLAKLMTTADVWLLFPITFYSGYELTFLWFEYSRAYAACLLGVNYVGWTNILYGLCASVLSFMMSYLLKQVGITPGIVFMAMVSLCQAVFMLSWTPTQEQGFTIFMMAVGFALSQSVANGQIRGLYGIYFPRNSAAFSAADMSSTAGLFFGSCISTYFCTDVKVYLYVFICILGLVCYMTLTVKHLVKISEVDINDEDSPSQTKPILPVA